MTLEQSIHDSLDNAVANGFAPHTWSVTAILDDLLRYDAEAEKHSPEELEPFIRTWMDKKARELDLNNGSRL